MSIKRRVIRCDNCGTAHRGKDVTCYECRTGQTYQPKHDPTALTGGRWVKRGMVSVFIKDAPEPVAPEPERDPDLPRIGRPTGCIRPIVFAGRPICGCGCLLARADEDCPNCRANLMEAAA